MIRYKESNGKKDFLLMHMNIRTCTQKFKQKYIILLRYLLHLGVGQCWTDHRKKEKIECRIRYCGIDEINWSYKFTRRGIGNATANTHGGSIFTMRVSV